MVHVFYVHVAVVLNLHVGDHHDVYIVRSCMICTSFNVQHADRCVCDSSYFTWDVYLMFVL